jgi:hypothetical protein
MRAVAGDIFYVAALAIFLSPSNKTAKTPRRISLSSDREASIPKTPTKRDNTPIILLVVAGVAALSTLAGYILKPNQSGAVTSTDPTTQSPATGDTKTP